MIPVAQKIKNIELYTKRLMHLNLLGHSRSLVKGSGLEFDQLRDYQIGDDVRAIDWNSSARMNKLLIKQFTDERYRTIIIALDISASVFYGSDELLKHDILARIAGIISFAGQLGKDEVGLILFTDTVELYIPPHKGKKHVHAILEKIFSAQQKHARTNINCVLEYIAKLRKKNAMVFLISDFIDEHFEQKLSLVARLCDVIAVRMIDDFEENFPIGGLITVHDSETQQAYIIDARGKNKAIDYFLQERLAEQKKLFNKYGVDVLDIHSKTLLIEKLIHFFKLRKR